MVHDIEYLYLDQKIADANAVRNASITMKPIMYAAFKIKDLYGYNPPKSYEVYNELKSKVLTDPNYNKILKEYDVKFSD